MGPGSVRSIRGPWLLAAMLSLTALVPRAAAAQAAAGPATEPERYGLQTLGVDVLALGVGLGIASSSLPGQLAQRPSDFAVVGTSLYLIGASAAPAVHFAHRQNGIGLADLGVRVFVPPFASLLGMGTYCLLTTERGEFRSGCAGTGAAGGLVAGAVVAAGFDAMVLAREQRTPTEIGSDSSQRWYGWQLLLVDSAGLALGLTAASKSPEAGKDPAPDALAVAGGMYVVGFFVPPIVHFVHGHLFRGLGDLAVRALLAPTGALVGLAGYCAATRGQSGCIANGGAYGFLAGVAGAALFDAAALSWDDVPVGSKSVRREVVVPAFRLVRGGGVLGAMGVF
jgi:hypothetical protein